MAIDIEPESSDKQKPQKHGMRAMKEYSIWVDMRRRCYQKNRKEYLLYGARGITVCDEWNNSFQAFISDMGTRPTPGHSLDRIDNNGPYCKENCKWSTPCEQSNNRRSNVILTLGEESMSVSEWARKLGVFKMTLIKRKNRGWSDVDILTKPLKNVGRRWKGNLE